MDNKDTVELRDASVERPLRSISGRGFQSIRKQTLSAMQEDGTVSSNATPTTYSLFSPTLHLQFLSFKFVDHAKNLEESAVDLKGKLESGLTQIAVISALIMSVEVDFMFTLEKKLLNTEERTALQIAFAAIVFLSFAMLTLSVSWAVFYMLMINAFTSGDELALWVKLSGWSLTIPHRLFMAGMFTGLATLCIHLLHIATIEIASGICGGMLVMFIILYFPVTYPLKCLYDAKEAVARGWRIGDKHD